jgi:hypothetical protein
MGHFSHLGLQIFFFGFLKMKNPRYSESRVRGNIGFKKQGQIIKHKNIGSNW